MADTLDFSKSQPLDVGAASTLDFSKAEKLDFGQAQPLTMNPAAALGAHATSVPALPEAGAKASVKMPMGWDPLGGLEKMLPDVVSKQALLPKMADAMISHTLLPGEAVHPYEKDVPQALQTNEGTPGSLSPGDSDAMRRMKGVGRAVYQGAAGMTTPENLALLGGMVAAPESRFSKMAGGIFSGMMLKGAGEEAYKSATSNETSERWEHGAGSIINALGGLLGADQLVHEAPKIAPETPRAEFKPENLEQTTPAVTEPEQVAPPQVDRRRNSAERQRVAQMSPEEMQQALLTSEKTGLPNRRAFDEAEKSGSAGAVAMSDADGLKALNDTYGYAAGDAMLKAKADALKQVGLDAYHEKGDEFLYRGDNKADLANKLAAARQILRDKTITSTKADGTPISFKGADFSFGLGSDLGESEANLKLHKGAREAAGERARGELRGITEVPQEPKVYQATVAENPPAAVAPPPQAVNPPVEPSALNAKESQMRPVIGSILRLKQLQDASQTRAEVQLAMKNVSSQLPFDAKYIGSMAKALGVSEDSLRDQNYHLTDDQVATVREMLVEGKRSQERSSKVGKPGSTIDLAKDHPEYPFAPKGIAPLAEVNEETLKAAGVGSTKDRWSMLTPKERAAYQAFKQQEYGASGSVAPEDQLSIEGQARRSGTVGSGKSAELLDYEHNLIQKTLERRLKSSRDSLNTHIQDWREMRKGSEEPSELAQQVAALTGRQRLSLPRELYSAEHLATKATEGTTSTAQSKPLPATETPTVIPAPEGTRAATLGKGQRPKPIVNQVVDLATELSEKYGEQVDGALPMISERVNAKYKEPGNVSAVMLNALREYQRNLENKVENPLEQALVNTVDKYKDETGTTGRVSANPVDVIWQKLFGPKQTATLKQPFRGTIPVPEQPLRDLTDQLKNISGPSMADRARAYMRNEQEKLAEIVRNAPSVSKDFLTKVKTSLESAWEGYKTRPGLSPLDWALGFRRLELTANALVMHEFHDEITRLHPERTRREAMVNYLQAGGGVQPDHLVNALLQQHHDAFDQQRLDLKTMRQGYSDAQHLTDAEKATVQKYREYDKWLSDQEEAQGLELQRRENYIRQMWSRDSFAQKQIDGIVSAAPFATNASWMKLRKYEDYFEGEMSGLKAHRKDLGYLTEVRARSSAEVLANRNLVSHLYEHRTQTGEKLAMPQGIGFSAEADPTKADRKGAVVLVKPIRGSDAITSDGRPYVAIQHSAFQNWKWIAKVDAGLDETGEANHSTDVMYKGNMLVHPDIARQLNRVLQPSALRKNMFLKSALKVSSIGKQTLLIGLFHPVQLAVHFTEHAAEGSTTARTMKTLNPFSKPIIDLASNDQKMLVIHGLKIADYNGEAMWDEGLMARGFANASPILGGWLRTLHDAMFTKYIPNIKMGMALDALSRNMGRFHDDYMMQELKAPDLQTIGKQEAFKLASQRAQSRIYRMTSEQMNSAFGGINWDALPVSKSMQDVSRLLVLAPDFLLARMQFVGDALRPGGRESLKALLVGAFAQYVAARAFNSAMNNGDPKNNIQDWNKFIVGRHQYSLRTVQGDLVDSMIDPRRFWGYRLNPITTRPVLEAWDQHDVFGHPASAGVQMMDFAKNIVPIPLQGLANKVEGHFNPLYSSSKHDEGMADTILQSLGLQARTYRTPAEKVVFQDFDDSHALPSMQDDWSLEQKRTFNELRNQYRDGTLKSQDIQDAVSSGRLKPSEFRYLFRTKNESQLVTRGRFLPPMQLLDAWKVATPMERLELSPLLMRKLKDLPPDQRTKTATMVQSYLGALNSDKLTTLRSGIQKEIQWEQGPTTPGVSQ